MKRILTSLGLCSILTLNACGSSDASPDDAASGNTSCTVGEPISGRVFVNGDRVPMLAEPRAGAEKVLNQRATEVMGAPEPRELNPAYGIEGRCRVPGFIQVAIVEVDGQPVTWETGWVEERHIAGAPSADQAAGLVWDVGGDSSLSEEEKNTAREGALRVLKEDPNCAKIVYVDRSTNSPGKFFATCSPRNGRENYNVTFSPQDVAAAARMGAGPPYPEAASRRACESAIRQELVNPRTLDLSSITGYATTTHNNGRRTIIQRFSAVNALGMRVTYEARCLVMPTGEVEIELAQVN